MARKTRRHSNSAYRYGLIALGFLAVGLLALTDLGSDVKALVGLKPGCDIKGNISPDGMRIYHVPGGHWYRKTKVDLLAGERWFCSESDARAAGWRRSRR